MKPTRPVLKVLDWGPNASRAGDALRELWALSPFAAEKWLAVAPMVVDIPLGCTREAALMRLRAAGVTVE
jgi:hypothetical protein